MSEALTPTHLREIPQEWLARWGAKGIPRLLLEELALHFVSLPVPGDEIDVENILRRLPKPKTFSYESSAESTSQLKSIRSTEELYIMAKQQAAKGNRVCADHPFLQLCQRNDPLLTEGFRRAVEAIVDYTPDCRPRQNKKLTPQQIDEITALWKNLFQGIDPLATNLLRQYCSATTAPLGEKPASRRLSPKKAHQGPKKRSSAKNETRRRITLLARAFIGSSKRKRGLAQWLHDLYGRGTPERIRTVVEQAFRRWDGTEIKCPTGGENAAYIAAGLNDSKEECAKTQIQGRKAIKRGLPKDRTKLVGDG